MLVDPPVNNEYGSQVRTVLVQKGIGADDH